MKFIAYLQQNELNSIMKHVFLVFCLIKMRSFLYQEMLIY